MQELIKINKDNLDGNLVETVDAKELHKLLEVKKKFTEWFDIRVKSYGFIRHTDFTAISLIGESGRKVTSYAITLDMAKQLSMVERSDKGREARLYFIECEKQARQKPDIQSITKTDLARMVIESESRVSELESKIEADRPKVEFAETFKASIDSVSMREFASRLNKKNLGRNKLFARLRQHNYLDKHNIPYSRYLKAGLFEVETETYKTKAGSHTTSTTMVTPKGQIYFEKKLR